ncbi:MAG: 4Fe-4S binding protein [Verrucomicrobiota bacterium]
MSYFAMSKLALKWAFKKPATLNYPFTPRVEILGSRGQLSFTVSTCTFCTVCAKKCPTGAIAVIRAQRKWTIDRLLCISCGACVDICPKDSLALGSGHGHCSVTKDKEVHQGEMPPPKPAPVVTPSVAPAPVMAN